MHSSKIGEMIQFIAVQRQLQNFQDPHNRLSNASLCEHGTEIKVLFSPFQDVTLSCLPR